MARIKLLDPSIMTDHQRLLYERLPVNLTRAILQTDFADSYLMLGFGLNAGKLRPMSRELVILRIAKLSGSRYERMHHLPLARLAGWSNTEIEAIESGRWELLDPPHSALMRYVDECVNDIRVSSQIFYEIQRYFQESEVVEMTLLVGFYMMTARFLESLDVDLDERPSTLLAELQRSSQLSIEDEFRGS